MAKGSSSKEYIFNKILEVFPGAFMVDAKTARIPLVEDGEPIEIKVALTAAKDILGEGADNNIDFEDAPAPFQDAIPDLTQEEKDTVKALMKKLGGK